MIVLYLDTNIFLNILLEEGVFVESSRDLLQAIEQKKYKASTSILTLMEIHRILQKQGKKEMEIDKAIQSISGLPIEISLPEGPDLLNAYEIIKRLKIDPADSIHLAMAMERNAVFVSRDNTLIKKIKNTIKTAIPEKLT